MDLIARARDWLNQDPDPLTRLELEQLIEQDDPSQRPVASGHGGGHQLGLYLIRLAGKQLERVQSPCTATRWKFGFFIPPGSDRGRFSLSLRHCVIQAKHPVTPLGW